MKRAAVRFLSERLDLTPAQEKTVAAAYDELHAAMQNARGEWGALRTDVSAAMAGESFDETVMGTAFARQDETLSNVRKAVVGAFAKVHESLDPQQRKVFADLLRGGFGGFRGGFGGGFGGGFPTAGGPYRV